MRNFDTYFSQRWSFLFLDTRMTQRRLCESYPLSWFQDFLHRVSPRLSTLRNECIWILWYTTQLWYTFQNSHSILVIAFSSFWWIVAFLWFSIWLFINLMMRTNTYPRLYNPFHFYRINIRADANIHKTFACTYLSNNNCTLVEEWTHVFFASNTSLPRHTSTSWYGWLRKCGGIRCRFLATVSLRTLAFFFPLVTDTCSSFNAHQSLSTLYHCSWFNYPMPGVKVSQSVFLISTPLHHGFQLLIIRSSSSDESPCRTNQTQFRLSKISSDGIFWHRQ